MGHIIAIAHIGKGQPRQGAKGFLNRQQIRQNLTGVFPVRQGIDHRNPGIVSEGNQFFLLKGADGQNIQIAVQHPGSIFQGFAPSNLSGIGIEVNDLATEVIHGHRETHPSSVEAL